MNSQDVRIGDHAITKIGRNEVKVMVIAKIHNGWRVKSLSTKSVFTTRKFERVINHNQEEQSMTEENTATEMNAQNAIPSEVPESLPPSEVGEPQEVPATVGGVSREAGAQIESSESGEEVLEAEEAESVAWGTDVEEDNRPNPAPESAAMPQPKKPSLLEAAYQVLLNGHRPMTIKEILKVIEETKLWKSTGRTPEQTLYSVIFRDIKSKGKPRFKRGEHKGCFEAIPQE